METTATTGAETTVDRIIDVLAIYGMKVIAAILILVIGLWLAGRLRSLFAMLLRTRGVEDTLVSFFSSLAHGALVAFIVIAAISKLGINTTSFAAVIAAAGLAVGLALQGSLSNFAAGVLLIIFKPFKIGDFVSAGGETGGVEEIGLLTTTLKTPDSKKIIVPNSSALGGSITNFSGYPTRRIDMVIGVSYSDDLDKVKAILEEVLAADERILKDPTPQVAVAELNSSSVDFVVRPWVEGADFWAVKFDFIKAIKERFDAEGISIPFPQRDVHLFEAK